MTLRVETLRNNVRFFFTARLMCADTVSSHILHRETAAKGLGEMQEKAI